MKRSLLIVSLAMLWSVVLAALAAGQETTSLWKADGISVLYRDLGENVEIIVQAPGSDEPTIKVDVNQNGQMDGKDVYYGLKNFVSPCNGYLINERLQTPCDARSTKSKLTLIPTTENAMPGYDWIIPKKEVSTKQKKGSMAFIVQVYNAHTQRTLFLPSHTYSFVNPFRINFGGAAAAP
jgi:hypothetical protein